MLENFPNPFNETTTIKYSIGHNTTVELSIYNLLGSKIQTIETSNKAQGNYSLEWSAAGIPEGIYLLQLKTNNELITRKIIVRQ